MAPRKIYVTLNIVTLFMYIQGEQCIFWSLLEKEFCSLQNIDCVSIDTYLMLIELVMYMVSALFFFYFFRFITVILELYEVLYLRFLLQNLNFLIEIFNST